MYYEQVLADQPRHPEAHHRLAILADRSGEYLLAEKHYLAAMREEPKNVDVLNDLGYSYFLQGRAKKAGSISAKRFNSTPNILMFKKICRFLKIKPKPKKY